MNKSNIYIIYDPDTNTHKIGYSSNPERRVMELSTGNSSKLSLVYKCECYDARYIERKIHDKYRRYRKNREWFRIPDFQVLLCDIDDIISNQEEYYRLKSNIGV